MSIRGGKPLKKALRILAFVALIYAGLLFAGFITEKASAYLDYREAKPFEPVFQAMAREMKSFASINGRPPSTLDELEKFSAKVDYTGIKGHAFTFKDGASEIFAISINKHYGFVIERDYTLRWVENPDGY